MPFASCWMLHVPRPMLLLFITDGDFHFYEAILAPGDRVDAANFDGWTWVIRHTDAAPVGEMPDLPQP